MSSSGKPAYDGNGRFLGYRGIARDVTQQAATEQALRVSEKCFRDFAEVASDEFWETDSDHRFRSVSDRWTFAVGRRRTEIAVDYDPESER